SRLVEASDVVVTNMPNGMLNRLKLDYETFRAIKPSIIHTNITAFGDAGPESESIGFDGIGQAMGGAVYLSGFDGRPTRCAASYVDYATAMASAFATAAAIYERSRTGEGKNIQSSLLRTALTITNPILIEEALGVRTRNAIGNRSPIAGPSDIFKTSDAWITVQVIGADMFRRWAELVGRPELVNEPRFADDIKRGENGEELSVLMQSWCDGRSSEDCLAALRSTRIPGCRVLAPKDVLTERQNVEGGFFNWVDFDELKRTLPLVSPVNPEEPPRPAPALGADTDGVLLEIGYSRADIDTLRQCGIIGRPASQPNN
ncbi:MAG: CoA transferase, partial [Legionella sp.]|nr:CoA transferase [Legionella sp.]